ncbi:MAG: peroxiredoxin [Alphaproteobacteria bacterium]|nr:peroxiredoxin [Alphaproteobacteria bacterium]
MRLKVGDRIPEANFMMMLEDLTTVSASRYFSGAKVAFFALPGAFTPQCTAAHVPSFLLDFDSLKAKGIDKIACLSVNDAFVMDAWATSLGAKGMIDFLADGNLEFTRAVGFELDASAYGMGTRSWRYSMIVESGVVKVLNVEDDPTNLMVSDAKSLLTSL